jgi:PAP2 superfamily
VVPAGGHRPAPEPTPFRSPGGLRSAIVGWWRGRYGARLAKEAAVIVALLLLYRVGRMLGRDESARAFDNARDVLALEDRLGIDTELWVQRATLGHPGVIWLLNRYYASVHFAASMAFLVFVYVRAPRLVAHIRFLFVTVTAGALIIHVVYPLAPPRMIDGYVDTIARYGPAIYDGQSAVGQMANQFAAMPSLHFGWAVLVAYGVARALDTRWRWLIVLHPAITLAAIVITANHYWLDALVAVVLIAAAMALEGERSRRAATTPRDDRATGPCEIGLDAQT